MAEQPRSQQAVFLANGESFRRWVDRVSGLLDRTTDARSAGTFIKTECGIKSRRELDSDPEKATAFTQLLKRYRTDREYWGLPSDDIAPQKRDEVAA